MLCLAPMSGIGIVLNPYSKEHKKDPDKMKRMAYIVGDKGSCKTTTDLQDLRRVAEEFKTRDIEILAIAGGDGTIHVVLTAFINVYGQKPLPKIALLGGGTMNNISTSVGARGSSEKLLSNLIHKYHEDVVFESTELDLMKVNDEYGFIFGCGFIYKFLETYYQGNMMPSPLKAFLLVSLYAASSWINGKRACAWFKRIDAEVKLGEQVWPFKNYSAILASSVPTLGLGSNIFYRAFEPRKLQAMGFSNTPRQLMKILHKLVVGKPCSDPRMIEDSFDQMTIHFEQPTPYTLDGDMIPPTSDITIGLGPRVTLIR